jgi:hypothetical protein
MSEPVGWDIREGARLRGFIPNEDAVAGGSLAELLRSLPALWSYPRPADRAEVHCHADVTDALAGRSAPPPPGHAALVTPPFGIDFFTDPGFGPGEWELRRGGKVVKSGRLR